MFLHLFFIYAKRREQGGAEKKIKVMILRNLSRNEKIAVLKSLVTVAGADGHLSNSESNYLGMFLIKMGEDQSILNSLNTISNQEVIRILSNFNYNDKQDLLYLWVEIATKSNANMTGVFRINDLTDAKETIMTLAKLCHVEIDVYKEYTFFY